MFHFSMTEFKHSFAPGEILSWHSLEITCSPDSSSPDSSSPELTSPDQNRQVIFAYKIALIENFLV